MEQTGSVKLARALKILVTITFICNLVVLPLVPLMIWAGQTGASMLEGFIAEMSVEGFLGVSFRALVTVWLSSYTAVLAAFLLFCGACTAIILWQARGVLGSVVKENTFTTENAKRMKIAAACMFLVSAAALLRAIWGFAYYKSIQPLFTYNALFIPVFLMAGLLCMVMSALFRQAAELKEENDLTI